METTQSKAVTVYVGADISKDTIAICYHSGEQSINTTIDNTPKAIQRFVKTMKVKKGAVLHFIMEATGSYSKTLYTTLRDLKIRFTQLNPRYSHAFAQSCGVLDKTDKKDANLLEEYGYRLTPMPTMPDEDLQIELKELYMMRLALVEEQNGWKQRKHQQSHGVGSLISKRKIKTLAAEIAVLDQAIAKRIKSQELLKALYDAIISIKGIGPCGAGAILCLLPEIGTLNGNQISKLAGVAPMQQQSGSSLNKTAHIRGGRKSLRKALYMPCVTATTHNPVIRACYQRVKNNKGGDSVKGAKSQALIAGMRKLLKHVNSVARAVREKMQRGVAAVGCGEAA